MAANHRPTALAHLLLSQVIRPGDMAIDATAGNGHDTVFLARLVGESGAVLAFDVQQAAIQATRARLEGAGLAERVVLYQESHAHLAQRAREKSAAAVMFNLGYLPGAAHEVITEVSETIAALDAAAGVLRPEGLLSVVCYPGHPGGEDEAAAVEAWFAAQTQIGWKITRHGAIGCRKAPPFLLIGVAP